MDEKKGTTSTQIYLYTRKILCSLRLCIFYVKVIIKSATKNQFKNIIHISMPAYINNAGC